MSSAPLPYALTALAAALIALTLAHWIGRARRRRRARLRGERAARGESEAAWLLAQLGYTVEAAQASTVWSITCNDQVHDIPLRADLIVSRHGARYVAEVKTGREAPRVTTAATRRQLLEYRLAYDVDGVLLVDAEAREVTRVEFPLPAAETATGPRLAMALAFIAGAGLGAALTLLFG